MFRPSRIIPKTVDLYVSDFPQVVDDEGFEEPDWVPDLQPGDEGYIAPEKFPVLGVAESLVLLQSLRQTRSHHLHSLLPLFPGALAKPRNKPKPGVQHLPDPVDPTPPHQLRLIGKCGMTVGGMSFDGVGVWECNFEARKSVQGQSQQRPQQQQQHRPQQPQQRPPQPHQGAPRPGQPPSPQRAPTAITPEILALVNAQSRLHPWLALLISRASRGLASQEELRRLGTVVELLARGMRLSEDGRSWVTPEGSTAGGQRPAGGAPAIAANPPTSTAGPAQPPATLTSAIASAPPGPSEDEPTTTEPLRLRGGGSGGAPPPSAQPPTPAQRPLAPATAPTRPGLTALEQLAVVAVGRAESDGARSGGSAVGGSSAARPTGQAVLPAQQPNRPPHPTQPSPQALQWRPVQGSPSTSVPSQARPPQPTQPSVYAPQARPPQPPSSSSPQYQQFRPPPPPPPAAKPLPPLLLLSFAENPGEKFVIPEELAFISFKPGSPLPPSLNGEAVQMGKVLISTFVPAAGWGRWVAQEGSAKDVEGAGGKKVEEGEELPTADKAYGPVSGVTVPAGNVQPVTIKLTNVSINIWRVMERLLREMEDIKDGGKRAAAEKLKREAEERSRKEEEERIEREKKEAEVRLEEETRKRKQREEEELKEMERQSKRPRRSVVANTTAGPVKQEEPVKKVEKKGSQAGESQVGEKEKEEVKETSVKQRIFEALLLRVPQRCFVKYRLPEPLPTELIEASIEPFTPQPYNVGSKISVDETEDLLPEPTARKRKAASPTVTFEVPMSFDGLEAAISKSVPRNRRISGNSGRRTGKRGEEGKRCEGCGLASLKVWRKGPGGVGTLCNGCGVLFQEGKLGELKAPGGLLPGEERVAKEESVAPVVGGDQAGTTTPGSTSAPDSTQAVPGQQSSQPVASIPPGTTPTPAVPTTNEIRPPTASSSNGSMPPPPNYPVFPRPTQQSSQPPRPTVRTETITIHNPLIHATQQAHPNSQSSGAGGSNLSPQPPAAQPKSPAIPSAYLEAHKDAMATLGLKSPSAGVGGLTEGSGSSGSKSGEVDVIGSGSKEEDVSVPQVASGALVGDGDVEMTDR